MALATTTAQNYYNLGWNMTTGTPKAGYTPAKGHLVFRTNNQADEWDLCVAGSLPAGIVESTNSGNGRITVAELVPGTRLILQHDQVGGPALGDKIGGTNTALGTQVARTVVTTNGGGVGRIIGLTPSGTGTVEVAF